ncbi:CHASE3 domain-containing protein [Streptomyces kunmingensis]|uniref:histidine kinase n=1 Tax=Streptomyces kunmingensis TaxID=68225 RepID=A0ABU6CHN5_9ACTN|nr:CHASE3 domain-containing protein [Streptomyces kunmingensis]MEB3963885.1 CHASE3 domain-containing protein [Streptomyces kunmingensis]
MATDVKNRRPATPRASWTTHRWLRVSAASALVVLAVLGGLGVWALNRASVLTDDLVDGHSPALSNAVRLEAALVNQETGVRGYGLTGERTFLAPYKEGLAAQRTAVRELRRLVADDSQGRADLSRVVTEAGRWQSAFAEPVAEAPDKASAQLSAQRSNQGKTSFDALRKAMVVQQDHLRAARMAATDDLRSATRLRDGIFISIALVILLLTALIFEGLRRGVTNPLAQLGADSRAVSRGNFEHPVVATGPADLRRLGSDIEAMRRRLLDELAFAEEARRRLDEQAAELRRSNSELEQFAYVASHDLQEPLRKVSSFTQLLQRRYDGQLDDRADQYIGFAVDGANRMQKLINDLLEFSRVGRVHNDHREVDLDTVVDQTLDSLSVAIEESGARIVRDPLPTVTGDSTQLGILWQNLIVNAVKFRHADRAPEIRIEAARDGDLWRCAVSDNGIGIAPEFAEKVFVIFQRLHTKDAYPGSGIGLAMCKKITEFHGGTIGIDPDHGPGTRIVFTLAATAPEPHTDSVEGAATR